MYIVVTRVNLRGSVGVRVHFLHASRVVPRLFRLRCKLAAELSILRMKAEIKRAKLATIC